MKQRPRPDIKTRQLRADHKRPRQVPPPPPSNANTASLQAAAALMASDAEAAEEARALEAQTQRRAARRAAQERRVKELARKAATDLGRGGWKESRAEGSVNFAREFKLGVAKKAWDGVIDDRTFSTR